MSEWKIKRLVDYWEFNPKVSVDNNKEYSFIEMPDLMPGNKEVLPSRERKPQGLTKFQNGDTLFAKITPCLENGKICQAQGLKDNIGVGSTEFFVFRGRKGISDNDFVHYLLKWYPIRKHAESCMSGSAGHQRVPSDAFDSIELPLPDYLESVEIANLLSLLDNKITLLRQQNRDLEELAQTLFKRWFVEFEFPNENGEPYKSSGGKMVESELGEIPEGWRLSNLGEFSTLKSGFAFKSNDFVDDSSVKAIKIKDLKGKGIVDISNVSSVATHVLTIERVKYFRLEEGDIVVAMSGNTTGKIGIIPPHENALYLNQRVGKFFLKEFSYKSFLYSFLMSGNYEERILSMGYGSAQPNINPSQIEAIEMLFPNEKLLGDYNSFSEPIYNKVLVNNEEIQTLTQLRDTLLPRLMSGEVRVKINNIGTCKTLINI